MCCITPGPLEDHKAYLVRELLQGSGTTLLPAASTLYVINAHAGSLDFDVATVLTTGPLDLKPAKSLRVSGQQIIGITTPA